MLAGINPADTEDRMPNLSVLENAMPVAPLKIIATESCISFAEKVNDYLVDFRANIHNELKEDPAFQGYSETNYHGRKSVSPKDLVLQRCLRL